VALENRWPRATHAPGPGGLPGRESCTPTAQARSSTRFMRFMAFAEKVSFEGRPFSYSSPQSSWAPAGKNRPVMPVCNV